MIKKTFECNRDGLTIRGTEFRNCEGKLPAVILSHGFMANQKSVRKYAMVMAELGYVAFTFDFNGGGIFNKSDGQTVDMTVLTEVEDLKSVINYVKSLPDVNEGRITLLGCSQGGFVSALTAKDLRTEIERLVLVYPAFCIPDDARKGKMLFARFDPQNVPDVIQRYPMKLGGGYAKCVMDWQVEKVISGYEGPVLFVHGTNDQVVDITYARKLHVLYPNVEYHEISGAKHGFSGKYDTEAIGYFTAFMQEKTKRSN